jgi:hypothetical protein
MKKKTEQVLPKLLQGSVHPQFIKCGNPNCKCADGFLHGPYYYHFVRAGGKLRKRYLRAGEVERMRIACRLRRRFEKQQRASSAASWEQLRKIRTEIKESINNYNR